ncbi:MAG TPA: 3-hydroxyacyl-[acyl-carrier-protein] dehydratase FabZ [Nitrospiraceae bacterium]|nr:3-hydroxyacyl-[acyl-carrier-protein] dehydratase FabZ [Nitrospiraceae bacterium]
MLDIREIQEILPHRYPFLLIDRIVEMELKQRIVAIKNVTINEPFFQGHFPGHPIMPGVLLLEAMAQAAGILAFRSSQDTDVENKVIYFMTIDKAKFRKPVVPGDQVRFEMELIKLRMNISSFKGRAIVDDALVAEAEMKAMLVDK